jgi:hypothetical protein
MHAGPEASTLQAAAVFAQVQKEWHYPDAELPQLDPAKDLRAQLGAWHRQVYERTYGRRSDAPDSTMLDSNLYFLFPQFCVWLSEAVPFSYQFTPHATDPQQSYFDVRLLKPFAEGTPRPAAAPAVEVGPDESIFKLVSGFSFLGMIFDQDMSNLPLVQRGLRAADPTRAHSHLGSFQESMIQHWHELFDRFMKS